MEMDLTIYTIDMQAHADEDIAPEDDLYLLPPRLPGGRTSGTRPDLQDAALRPPRLPA